MEVEKSCSHVSDPRLAFLARIGQCTFSNKIVGRRVGESLTILKFTGPLCKNWLANIPYVEAASTPKQFLTHKKCVRGCQWVNKKVISTYVYLPYYDLKHPHTK